MNPKQLRVVFRPDMQRWFLVRVQPKVVTVIRDVTQDMIGCLLGEMKQEGPNTEGIEWVFSHTALNGDSCTIQMTAKILELNEGSENGN